MTSTVELTDAQRMWARACGMTEAEYAKWATGASAEGSGAPPTRSRAPSAQDGELTADELAYAKAFGMTPEEYAAHKATPGPLPAEGASR